MQTKFIQFFKIELWEYLFDLTKYKMKFRKKYVIINYIIYSYKRHQYDSSNIISILTQWIVNLTNQKNLKISYKRIYSSKLIIIRKDNKQSHDEIIIYYFIIVIVSLYNSIKTILYLSFYNDYTKVIIIITSNQ